MTDNDKKTPVQPTKENQQSQQQGQPGRVYSGPHHQDPTKAQKENQERITREAQKEGSRAQQPGDDPYNKHE